MWAKSVDAFQRALELQLRDRGTKAGLAETRFALARAQRAGGGDVAGSAALATLARDAYRELAGYGAEVAEVDAWLAAAGRRSDPAAQTAKPPVPLN